MWRFTLDPVAVAHEKGCPRNQRFRTVCFRVIGAVSDDVWGYVRGQTIGVWPELRGGMFQ